MREYYTDKQVAFFLECILESRDRGEIMRDILKNRNIGPSTDPDEGEQEPLEQRGNYSPNKSAYEHIKKIPNSCAIMTLAHATGEHPVKIFHRLIRDHVKHPATSTSYVRGGTTHPHVLHHLLKRLGYKMKKVPREEHGHFIHDHNEIHNVWYDFHHPDDEEHEDEEKHQKELFHNANDAKRHPLKKPFKGDPAHIVAENAEHGKRYLAVTHHMTEDPSDEYIDSASGKNIVHIDGSGVRSPTAHTFNISRNKVRDHSRYSMNNTEEHQVSHLYEIQKDHKHPRWTWKWKRDHKDLIMKRRRRK